MYVWIGEMEAILQGIYYEEEARSVWEFEREQGNYVIDSRALCSGVVLDMGEVREDSSKVGTSQRTVCIFQSSPRIPTVSSTSSFNLSLMMI